MKRIVILGYTAYRLDFYRYILKKLVPENVQIQTALLSELLPGKLELNADVAVLTSPYFTAYIKQHLSHVTSVILASYTLEQGTLRQIQHLEQDGPFSVVGDGNLVDSNRKMMLLEKLGIRRSSMSVWHSGMEIQKLAPNVLLFGQASIPEPGERQVLKISQAYFSTSTILEIFCSLGMPELATNPAFYEYYTRMCTQMFCNPNQTVASFHEDLLDELAQEGLILLSNGNIIEYCDRYVENILGISQEELIGKNVSDFFPALFPGRSNEAGGFRERIITFRGRQYIFSVNTVSRGQDQVSYIRISNYWEQEKRQSNLRCQLVRKRHIAKYTFENIQGISPEIQATKKIARRIARSEANVLITGESGVGKELFAQAIHNASDRCQNPFVAINCGAMVESLLESELFGYEGGAFTGARKEGKLGLFELAHTGTLFLDEIGDMPLHLQVRLLRVLQERELTRVGGDTVIPVDVRIIAATNKDLNKMIQAGDFRSDLFYRLNVLPLYIPPLRKRRDDILYLLQEFQKDNRYPFDLTSAAEAKLLDYPFYGNVRELENCVEYLANLNLPEITPADLPAYIQQYQRQEKARTQTGEQHDSGTRMRILRIVQSYNTQGLGAGRRTIQSELDSQGYPATETVIRSTLDDLRKSGLIFIYKGRRGIELTEEGRRHLNGEWDPV